MLAKRVNHFALFFLLVMSCACGVSFKVGTPRPQQPVVGASGKALDPEEAKIRSALKSIQGQGKVSGYTIGPADLLDVSVFEEPDLGRKARVSPEGIITVPLAGEVKVGGLSVSDAEQLIARRLKKFLKLPQVSILILEYGNKQVYVLGEVTKPGAYALPTEAPMTVLEAISLAGGFTAYAAKDRTRIIRQENGQSVSYTVPVSEIMKYGTKDKDIPLKANDVVYVPERLF